MYDKIFLVFFDAKMKTYTQRKAYQNFVKKLKGSGYSMLQKSVYYRRYIGTCEADHICKIKNFTPPSVQVRILLLSDKKFSTMENVNCELPEKEDDIICV